MELMCINKLKRISQSRKNPPFIRVNPRSNKVTQEKNMKKSILTITAIISLSLVLTSLSKSDYFTLTKDTSVAEVLIKLGERPMPHQPMMNLKGVSVENGKRLVLEGFASRAGSGKTSKQSAHFVCTSCHNIERDEPNLGVVDAQARLEYSVKKGLPMLQGSSLYGVVNRSSFYNGDYERKYGDLTIAARNDLRNAIQLCATECAQGRKLANWEVESVLAYLWTIDLKTEDLNLSKEEMTNVEIAINKETNKEATISLLKSKYLSGAPATFVKPPENRKEGYAELIGNPANGKLIYESSCLHCHDGQKYSYFNLGKSEISYNYLEKHFPKYTRYSTYQVTRYGTSPLPGKKAYMPLYTAEKMTNQMAEDLRAYVKQEAK